MAPPSKDQFIRQSHPACHDKQLCIDTHQMVEAVWKHAPTDKRGKVELHQFNTRMARELQTTFGNGWHIVTGLHFAVQIRYVSTPQNKSFERHDDTSVFVAKRTVFNFYASIEWSEDHYLSNCTCHD